MVVACVIGSIVPPIAPRSRRIRDHRVAGDLAGMRAILRAVSLEIDHVTKRFGTTVALDGLAFEVARGEVFGFLGANGAGKTTTMRICLGILRADAGEIRWDGRPTDGRCRAGRGATCPRSAASTRGWASSTSSSTSRSLYGDGSRTARGARRSAG